MTDISKHFVSFLDKNEDKFSKIKCNGQQLNTSDYSELYQALIKMKNYNNSKFYDTFEQYSNDLNNNDAVYKFYFDSEKICLPKYKTITPNITVTDKYADVYPENATDH